MDRVRFIEHRGKAILFIDLSGCATEGLFPLVEEAKAAIRTQRHGSVLTLTDVTDTCFDSTLSVAMKELVQHNKPYVAAAAVVGVTGLKQIILNSVMRFSGRHLHAFPSLDEAKDWLASQ